MRTLSDYYRPGQIEWIGDATAGPFAGYTLSRGEVITLDRAHGGGRAVRFAEVKYNGERKTPILKLEGKPALTVLADAELARIEAEESAARKLEAELKALPDSACFEVEVAVGQSFRRGEKDWTVIGYTRRRVWDNYEDEWVWRHVAGCRPATSDEVIAKEERSAVAVARKQARTDLDAIAKDLRERGERPDGGNVPEGIEVAAGGSERIYGGGKWFVLGAGWIWFVQNNGADGDDWSYNNVSTGGAGAIGWRVPHDPELAARIGKLAALGYPGD